MSVDQMFRTALRNDVVAGLKWHGVVFDDQDLDDALNEHFSDPFYTPRVIVVYPKSDRAGEHHVMIAPTLVDREYDFTPCGGDSRYSDVVDYIRNTYEVGSSDFNTVVYLLGMSAMFPLEIQTDQTRQDLRMSAFMLSVLFEMHLTIVVFSNENNTGCLPTVVAHVNDPLATFDRKLLSLSYRAVLDSVNSDAVVSLQ